jgi:hypothetical protein
MRSVSRQARASIDIPRLARHAARLPTQLPTRLPTFAAAVASVAVALFVAAPAVHAQSADDAPAARLEAPASALRGWPASDAGQLDDQTLARQRGGAVGMVMIAATPALMRGNGVTLWDEIAPPAPLPIPVDASQQSAQGNVASYTRR